MRTLEELMLPPTVLYYCWSDSTVALGWIKGEPAKWKVFICNRVQEIVDLTNPASWTHCPGMDNPADYLMQGFSAAGLLESALWWKGVPWLFSSEFPEVAAEA